MRAKSTTTIGEKGFCGSWWTIVPLLILFCAVFPNHSRAQDSKPAEAPRTKRVLMLFSEARDLPGNTMMEQAVRAEMLRGTNHLEFFAENLDAGRFSDPSQPVLFKDYLEKKYAGKNLDVVIAFMA